MEASWNLPAGPRRRTAVRSWRGVASEWTHGASRAASWQVSGGKGGTRHMGPAGGDTWRHMVAPGGSAAATDPANTRAVCSLWTLRKGHVAPSRLTTWHPVSSRQKRGGFSSVHTNGERIISAGCAAIHTYVSLPERTQARGNIPSHAEAAMSVWIHVHLYVSMHSSEYASVYICVCVYACMYLQIYIYVCAYVNINMLKCTHICVCTCTLMNVCT